MTDKTSDTPNGIGADLGEPSMEDILASIRRIIAEDDVADQGHIDALGDLVIAPDPEAAVKEVSTGADDILVLDDLVQENADVDDLLADLEVPSELELDTVVDDIEIGSDATTEFNPVSSVMSDLEDKLTSDRGEAPDLQEVFDAQDITGIASVAPALLNDDDDGLLEVMDNLDLESGPSDIELALSDNVMKDLEEAESTLNDPLEGIVDVRVSEDLDDDDGLDSDVIEGLSTKESDLDIVKSLMADLTDTSFLDIDADDEAVEAAEVVEPMVEADESDENDMSIFDEIESAADESNDDVPESSLNEAEIEDEDVLISDILDLTLQDEEALSMDSLDLTIDEEPAVTAEPVSNDRDEDASSLLQIAAAAEADAGNVTSEIETVIETEPALDIPAALATPQVEDDLVETLLEPEGPSTEELLSELDLALAEVTQADNQEIEIVTEIVAEAEQELVLEPEIVAEEVETEDLFVDPQETEDMAKTARKNAIINEVTEEATSDAFAELTKAVDDKAVYTESGPRVGDIVQDALRPMLKEWLDDNLKGIVERAVAKEVKRISSGK